MSNDMSPNLSAHDNTELKVQRQDEALRSGERLAVVRPKVQYKFWAALYRPWWKRQWYRVVRRPWPWPETLDALAEKMRSTGNTVLEVDEAGQRLLCGTGTTTAWGCRFCLDAATRGEITLLQVTVVDSEQELNAHAKEIHGWEP